MKWGLLLFWSLLLVICCNFSRCSSRHAESIDTLAIPIFKTVDVLNISPAYFDKKVKYKTRLFYQANNLKKAWLGPKRPGKNYKAFAEEVADSYKYGMIPENYHITELNKQIDSLYDNRKRTEADISRLEVKITASFFLFTTHLLEGRIRNPGAQEFIWKRGMPHEDDVSLLLKMESAGDVRKEIGRLHPENPQYKKLQYALKNYLDLADTDSFPSIPEKVIIHPGDTHPDISLVRNKIQLTDLNSGHSPDDPLRYDDKLVKAITQFQKRHGLKADGVIRSETIKHLNIPLKQKADLIALNLERLRWSPHPTFDNDEIIVNVPEYMLRIYRNKKEKLSMKVVLGDAFNATPVFSDTLEYIVFSPKWYVPESIIIEEIIPNLKKNPAHYSNSGFVFYKNDVEIDPLEESWPDDSIEAKAYRVVQNPGTANALGNIKFIMPNNFSIYLHDTPAEQLFTKEARALSHGCIRLEKPVELAAYLLEDQRGWNKKNIQEAMQAGEPKTVHLKKSYPVNIIYQTAWVDDEGLVNFREDVYDHDKRQLSRLHKSQHLSKLTR